MRRGEEELARQMLENLAAGIDDRSQAARIERIQYHRAFRVLTRFLHDHRRMVRPPMLP